MRTLRIKLTVGWHSSLCKELQNLRFFVCASENSKLKSRGWQFFAFVVNFATFATLRNFRVHSHFSAFFSLLVTKFGRITKNCKVDILWEISNFCSSLSSFWVSQKPCDWEFYKIICENCKIKSFRVTCHISQFFVTLMIKSTISCRFKTI